MSKQLDIFGDGPGSCVVGKRKKTSEEWFREYFGYSEENVCGDCCRFENELCRLRGKTKVNPKLMACSKFVESK